METSEHDVIWNNRTESLKGKADLDSYWSTAVYRTFLATTVPRELFKRSHLIMKWN